MSKFLQGQCIRSVSGKTYDVIREVSEYVDHEVDGTVYKLRDIEGDIVTLESGFVDDSFRLV